MSDLVERLRFQKRYAIGICVTMDEAADEIERLTHALNQCDCTNQQAIAEDERHKRLVAEAVREACAKVADGYVGADPIAAAIRALDLTKIGGRDE
jgi:hypothetical protein